MTDPRKPLLRTPSGTVSGSVATTADGAGVAVFRAAPVAHTAHFGAPEPPAPWSGVLDCTDTAERRGLRLPTTVSVFAPVDAGTATALPVIAWIHGGRYEEGHGDDGWYDGTTLAAAGCVVVTLNYRMCLEGFLPLDDDAPGSFRGVDDLVHALEWVRDTVPDLGGDPGNVTLFGQSAGGGLVMTLLTDRRADTLFHRAVVLSPGLPRILPRIGWTLRRAVARVCLGSRLTHARVSRLSVARCRRAYRRMAAVYASDCALGPGPVPLDDLREVPLLVSTMQDEFVRFPGVSQLDRAAHRLRLPAAVMTPGMLLLGVPWRNLPRWWGHVDADRPMGRTVGDTMILRWAAGLLEKAPGDDVWACEFRGGPWRDGRIDAQHCGELPMFFDTLTVGTRQVRQMCGPDAVERLSGLGGQVRDVLLGFARGGDPGWGRWSDGRATRVFDLTGGPGTTAHDPLHAVRTLLPVRD